MRVLPLLLLALILYPAITVICFVMSGRDLALRWWRLRGG
jgi:hypothetical protein